MRVADRPVEEIRALLEYATPEEAIVILASIELTMIEDDPRRWLRRMFPAYFVIDFAEHHAEFWRWVWTIRAGVKPDDAFIAVWPRGGAKSTSAEAACVALGARRARNYGLYICETQAQADDHVANVGSLLESPTVGLFYPSLGSRLVDKYGSSKGWRRNRLRTAGGFTIDALGLDTAARGVKMDEDRPDLMVFDDIDDEADGLGQVDKKIKALTEKLLPAGAAHLAVLGIQNIPNPHGIFARLCGVSEERADFLANRIVSGPIPALVGFTYEERPDGGFTIVAGESTWDGQDLQRCQEQVDEWGITAFRKEAQHDTDAIAGGMFDHLTFQHVQRALVPVLVRVECWVDPAVTNKDSSDSMGIQCDGLSADGTIYRLRSWERRASPVDALRLAIVWALLEGAIRVGVETDQGGDTWQSVYKEAFAAVEDDLARLDRGDAVTGPAEYVPALVELVARGDRDQLVRPFFDEEKAGTTQESKAARAQRMLVDYERPGRIVHVLGSHLLLEAALVRFPRRKPFDLVDVAFWSWRALRRYGKGARSSGQSMARRALPAVSLVGSR